MRITNELVYLESDYTEDFNNKIQIKFNKTFFQNLFNVYFSAGELENSEWSCWTEWSSCTSTCGGPGSRQRSRGCMPGNSNIGSQDVNCTGKNFELDETCGSSLLCPEPHCPYGYQYSKE